MFNLEGINEQARFFCVLGYSRERVVAVLRKNHPRASDEAITAAWDAAVAQHRESERQLDAAVRKDDAAARRAEHNLDQSMHDA